MIPGDIIFPRWIGYWLGYVYEWSAFSSLGNVWISRHERAVILPGVTGERIYNRLAMLGQIGKQSLTLAIHDVFLVNAMLSVLSIFCSGVCTCCACSTEAVENSFLRCTFSTESRSSWVFMGLHWTGQGSERMALSKGEYNPIIGFPHHHKIIMYFPGVIPVTLTFWQFLTHRSIAHDYWWLYTCIFQRAWISAWPQISACGGNWKLRRKVILSIFWGILIRSWWTIQVKRNALWVMFAVFLFWFLIFIFFFGRKHPRNGRKHPRNRRKHPKWDFHVKQ